MGSKQAITTRINTGINELQFVNMPTLTQTNRSILAAKLLIGLFIVFSTVSQTFAQSKKEFDKKWELAKGHYDDGNYDIAVMLFQSLTPELAENKYVEYANYYTALCYFNEGKLLKSREYLLQLKDKYPNWGKMNRVYYLLANIDFINKNYERALVTLEGITDQKIKNLKFHYLSKIKSVHLVNTLHQKFPDDIEVATVLAYNLANKHPLMEADKQFIYSLISKYDIKEGKLKNHLESSTENHFKDTFNIALFSPFNLEELEKYKPSRKNQFVIDHYWGMSLALDTLSKQSINLKLTTYDTKDDTNQVSKILLKDEVKQMDVIVGPVYKKNVKLISKYCTENQIVGFNPFSNQSRTISDSGFVYMYNPSYESIGTNAAKLVLDSFSTKEVIILCFNSNKDTTIANAFIQELKSDTTFVAKIHRVYIEKGEDVLYPLSKIKSSKVGVVFAPSQNTSVASALTSWLIMRELEIPIIGNSTWFNSQEFNIVNFNKREAYFFDENYINYQIDTTYKFKEKYFEKYNVPPSDAAYKGFELAILLGNNLTKYGKYFNQALWNMESQGGVFYPQFNYNNSYSNNFVPILKLQNYQLLPANYSVEKEPKEEISNDTDKQ